MSRVRAPRLSLELRPQPPFRLDLTVWALRRGAQNAIDSWDGRTYRRALIAGGVPLGLAATQVGLVDAPSLEIAVTGPDLTSDAVDHAHSALTLLLGLELDLNGFYARAARDPALRLLADRYRGVKPPRFPTVFESLVNAIACQQLSLPAGLSLLSRLAATAGRSAGALHAFPTPEDVLRCPRPTLRSIGFSERKTETIHEVARAALAGELELSVLESLDDTSVAATLMRRRGIGRWSADYVLLRGLGRLHVFPQGDVGARNALRAYLHAARVDADPESLLDRWAPDAGMVYLHLLLRGLEARGAL